MKVLFFIGQLSGGGAERSLITIANELANRGNEVTISVNKQMMVFKPNSGVSVIYANQEKTATQGRGIIRSLRQFKNYLHYFPYTRRTIRGVKPDVIVSFLWCNLLQILLYHKNIPIITSERNAFDRELGFVNHTNRFLLNRFVDCITVQTPFDKGFAAAKRLKHTVIMPNPLTWDVVSEEEFDILFPDRKNLLACGRVDQWEIKGFDLLIKAFAGIANSFPNWFLDIAGKGSDKSVSKLKGIAKEYGIEDRIRFLGFQTDVREVMKSHAIFVLSSRTEGFPNVLAEAMSVGMSTISYERLANSIILDSIDGMLVKNQSVEELSYAMSSMMEEEQLRYVIGKNALKNIRRFSISRVVDKWERLLTSLTNV